MKIAFLVNFCHRQGTYYRFHHFAVCLTDAGHEVKVYAVDIGQGARSRVEVRDGVEYHITGRSPGHRFLHNMSNPLTAVRRLFLPYEPVDIAHVWQPFLSAGLTWLTRMKGLAKARLYDWDDLWTTGPITGERREIGEYYNRAMTDRLEHRIPSSADHVTAISTFLHDLAVRRGARNVSILHNGYVPHPIPVKAEARRELGLRADAFYAGFMGRTTNELPWTVNALRRHRDRFPNLRLAISGIEVERIRPMLQGVEDRVDPLGQLSEEKVALLPGALDLGLVPMGDDLFNRARLPLKLFYHLGAGVPILCSDIGEAGLLGKTVSGVVLTGTDEATWIEDFGRTVERFLAGDRPAVDVEFLRSNWSWEAKTRELLQTYQRCLSAS